MKSSLKNMVLVLLSITLVSAAALGFIYGLTKEPIENAKRAKTTGALAQVLPEFDNDPSQEMTALELDGFPITVYTAKKGSTPVGYAVETATGHGFSGLIKMMVGFQPDGKVHNIEVLEHNETPGLGSKMADPDNVLVVSFRGKNPADMKLSVKKDGGDVDVITASTISSRAYTDAVARAFKAFGEVVLGVTAEEEAVDPVATVLPVHDAVSEEGTRVAFDSDTLTVYTAYAGDKIAGYAVETFTKKAFKGRFDMMVGFDPAGTISGIHITKQEETPGYGGAISEPDNALAASFIGHKPAELKMRLKPDGDIDMLTGSTITSEAYIDAVERAYKAFIKTGEVRK